MNPKKWAMAFGFVFLFGGSIFLYKGNSTWLASSLFSNIWEDFLGEKYLENVTQRTKANVGEETKSSLEAFEMHHKKLRDRFITKGYFYESENTMYEDEMGFMPRSIQHSEEHKNKLKQALDTSKEIEALLKKAKKEACMICQKQAPGNPGQSQCMKSCR